MSSYREHKHGENKMTKYSTLFRGKYAVSPEGINTLEDLAAAIEKVAAGLRAMGADGLQLDPGGGGDDYWFIFTHDEALAEKYSLEEDEDDEEDWGDDESEDDE